MLPNDDLMERIRKLEDLYDDAFRSEAEVFFRICKKFLLKIDIQNKRDLQIKM